MALQIALPYATDLPPDSGLAVRRSRIVKPAPLPAYSTLGQDDVFDPTRGKGGAGTSDAVSQDALQAMGVISSGRGAAALIKGGGSSARFVRPGASIGGWRVVSIGHDAVWVEKGGARRRLAVGASPEPPTSAPTPPADPGTPTE